MQVFRTSKSLISHLQKVRESEPQSALGFVPTMGALHQGHLKLVRSSKNSCDYTVVSIFINPTQFNNTDDLEMYPRNEEQDLALLQENGCDFVFIPTIEDVYPNSTDSYEIELGILDDVLEGKYRPDHFRGVAMVVERFFRLVKADKAFFGEKDFQQLAVIRRMAKVKEIAIDIIGVETERSSEGLALSSRNERLTVEQLKDALFIFETLTYARTMKQTIDDPQLIAEKLRAYFKNSRLQLEYLEIVDSDSFLPATEISNSRICVAAYCGEVRLIDNMAL